MLSPPPPPDLCAGSRGGEEMKQDGSLMNVHSCLPRLILSVQTGPRAGERRAAPGRAHIAKCGEVFKVSMRVCPGARYTQKHTHISVTLVSNQPDLVLHSAVPLLDAQSAEVNRRSRLVESRFVRCVFYLFTFFILFGFETQFDLFTSFKLQFFKIIFISLFLVLAR